MSNHVSHIDVFTFGHFLNDHGIVPHFLGKVEVFSLPVIGSIVRAAEQIPVYRETGQAVDAYRAAVAAIREGKCVALYPEGTLTRQPELWPMRAKTGAARIALETQCPVIPIAQWGPQGILAPYGHRPSLLPRHTIKVRAGEPVDLEDLYGQPVTAEVLADASERIMAAVTRELEVLRGELAPSGRFDPRAEGITVTGRPRAATPTERSGPHARDLPPEWPQNHPDDVEDNA